MCIKANFYTTQSYRKLVAGNGKVVAENAKLVAKKSNERNPCPTKSLGIRPLQSLRMELLGRLELPTC